MVFVAFELAILVCVFGSRDEYTLNEKLPLQLLRRSPREDVIYWHGALDSL